MPEAVRSSASCVSCAKYPTDASWPQRTSPLSGFTISCFVSSSMPAKPPIISLRSVDLPMPFGPVIAILSPRFTWNEALS